jgi:hypothetical protein
MREIPPRPESVDDRIDFIVDLMANLEWERGKTAKKIAAAWDLSIKTVEGYSATASRIVVADEDDARRDITAGCRKLMRDALQDGNAKDFGVVGKLLAEVSGAKAPEKHQVGALDDVTPQKAREVMAGLFGTVTPDAADSGDGDSESEAPASTPKT